MAERSHQFAGVGIRAAAAIVDFLLVGIVGGALLTLLSDSLGSLINLAFLPIALGYFIVLEAYNGGQTVGKMATGIKVTTDTGGELTLGGSVIRNVLRIVDQLPFLYAVGLLLIVLTDDKQRLGDLAAKTVVMKA